MNKKLTNTFEQEVQTTGEEGCPAENSPRESGSGSFCQVCLCLFVWFFLFLVLFVKNQSGSCLYCHICGFHFHTHSIFTHIHLSLSTTQSQNPWQFLHGANKAAIQVSTSSLLPTKMHKQIQIQESLLHWPRPKLTKHWDGWSRTMTSKEPNTFKVKDHGIPKQMTKDHCIPRNIIYQGRWHWWLKSTRTPPSINCHWRVCYVIQIGNLGVILLLAKVVTLLCRTALRESRLQGQFPPFWSQKCFTDYRPLVWRLSMLQRREEDFFAEKTSCLEIYFSCLSRLYRLFIKYLYVLYRF